MQQLPLEHAVVFLSSVMRSDAQVVRAAVFHGLMVHWGRSHPSGAVLLCHRHAGHSWTSAFTFLIFTALI